LRVRHISIARRYTYRAVVEAQMSRPVPEYEAYPCLVHAWDNTPRAGRNGVVFTGASPALFGRLLDGAVRVLRDKPPERRLLFLKSWNEWAEGNYLEPDLALGDGYLRAVAASLGVVPAPDG
jgi:hypothetical protein